MTWRRAWPMASSGEAAAIVDQWVIDDLHNSPLSRNVGALSHLMERLPNLRSQLA